MEWSIVTAVNDEQVLRSCLLRSPDVQAGKSVFIERGHASAASAYNAGIQKVNTDLVMFIHQDMYLPEGWFAQAEKALEHLETQDPNWGVVGVWGATRSGTYAGHLYWTGIGKPRGEDFEGGVEVGTLDEVILIFKKSSGLRFDSNLPGYHMYGPDICLQARGRGRKCYAISPLSIHNANTYGLLPLQFWQCFWYMRKKWRDQLPIYTPCAVITRWCKPAIRWNVVRAANLLLGRHKNFKRVADPSLVYDQLQGGKLCETASQRDLARSAG